MGTGPCSLRPTCAKWSASNEADTARSYRPLQPAPPAHAYSSTMSVGIRPCTSMSSANVLGFVVCLLLYAVLSLQDVFAYTVHVAHIYNVCGTDPQIRLGQ